MKLIEKDITINRMNDPLFKWMSKSNIAYLDIETTGLSPKSSAVILMGLVKAFNKETTAKTTLHQCLCSSPVEEQSLLEWTLKNLEGIDIIVTYNGAKFDIPFINKRMDKYGLPNISKKIYHIDILQLVRNYSHLKDILPNLKQKTIEQFLKRDSNRLDQISGADSVVMYDAYVETGSKQLEETILLHNHDDIFQLSTLTQISNHCNYHQFLCHKGIPLRLQTSSNQDTFAYIKPNLKGTKLIIEGYCQSPANYLAFFTPSLPFQAKINDCQLNFELDLQKIDKYLAIDLTPFEENFSSISKQWLSKQHLYSNGYFVLGTQHDTNYYQLAVVSSLITKEIFKIIDAGF